MTKDELRDELYSKYFLTTDGIRLKALMSKVSCVVDTWKKFRSILERKSIYLNQYGTLRIVRNFVFDNKEYLVIQIGCFQFFVIDLQSKRVVSREEVSSYFDDEFFNKNYISREINSKYLRCRFEECKENIRGLISFYNKNKSILNLPREIYYKIDLGEARTYIKVDLLNDFVSLGFVTSDQLLYEHLFMNCDLNPCRLQDGGFGMDKAKINEIFDSKGEIMVPKHVIPESLLELETSVSKELK